MGQMWYINLLERNQIPDPLIRQGIRWYNQQHLKRLANSVQTDPQHQTQILKTLSEGPLAIAVEAANQQHYELPAAFFEQVLGPHLKYSCAYWKSDSVSLAQAESDMLELYCQRAQLHNARQILELGCGWGSLTLYMARKYPEAQIKAVSNSHSQRQYILARAAQLGLQNLKVETCDINEFVPQQRFDRIVSVEMFEHLRNYQLLFERLQQWLSPEGLIFVHVFVHRNYAYTFEPQHARDWMARYFFTGGTMPSQDLLPYFARPYFETLGIWPVNGKHYARTANAWLKNMHQHRDTIWPVLVASYGAEEALKWWSYWRIFFMACAELFGHAQGEAWQVTHYLFGKKR